MPLLGHRAWPYYFQPLSNLTPAELRDLFYEMRNAVDHLVRLQALAADALKEHVSEEETDEAMDVD